MGLNYPVGDVLDKTTSPRAKMKTTFNQVWPSFYALHQEIEGVKTLRKNIIPNVRLRKITEEQIERHTFKSKPGPKSRKFRTNVITSDSDESNGSTVSASLVSAFEDEETSNESDEPFRTSSPKKKGAQSSSSDKVDQSVMKRLTADIDKESSSFIRSLAEGVSERSQVKKHVNFDKVFDCAYAELKKGDVSTSNLNGNDKRGHGSSALLSLLKGGGSPKKKSPDKKEKGSNQGTLDFLLGNKSNDSSSATSKEGKAVPKVAKKVAGSPRRSLGSSDSECSSLIKTEPFSPLPHGKKGLKRGHSPVDKPSLNMVVIPSENVENYLNATKSIACRKLVTNGTQTMEESQKLVSLPIASVINTKEEKVDKEIIELKCVGSMKRLTQVLSNIVYKLKKYKSEVESEMDEEVKKLKKVYDSKVDEVEKTVKYFNDIDIEMSNQISKMYPDNEPDALVQDLKIKIQKVFSDYEEKPEDTNKLPQDEDESPPCKKQATYSLSITRPGKQICSDKVASKPAFSENVAGAVAAKALVKGNKTALRTIPEANLHFFGHSGPPVTQFSESMDATQRSHPAPLPVPESQPTHKFTSTKEVARTSAAEQINAAKGAQTATTTVMEGLPKRLIRALVPPNEHVSDTREPAQNFTFVMANPGQTDTTSKHPPNAMLRRIQTKIATLSQTTQSTQNIMYTNNKNSNNLSQSQASMTLSSTNTQAPIKPSRTYGKVQAPIRTTFSNTQAPIRPTSSSNAHPSSRSILSYAPAVRPAVGNTAIRSHLNNTQTVIKQLSFKNSNTQSSLRSTIPDPQAPMPTFENTQALNRSVSGNVTTSSRNLLPSSNSSLIPSSSVAMAPKSVASSNSDAGFTAVKLPFMRNKVFSKMPAMQSAAETNQNLQQPHYSSAAASGTAQHQHMANAIAQVRHIPAQTVGGGGQMQSQVILKTLNTSQQQSSLISSQSLSTVPTQSMTQSQSHQPPLLVLQNQNQNYLYKSPPIYQDALRQQQQQLLQQPQVYQMNPAPSLMYQQQPQQLSQQSSVYQLNFNKQHFQNIQPNFQATPNDTPNARVDEHGNVFLHNIPTRPEEQLNAQSNYLRQFLERPNVTNSASPEENSSGGSPQMLPIITSTVSLAKGSSPSMGHEEEDDDDDDDVDVATQTCFICGVQATTRCCGQFVYCGFECKEMDSGRHESECTAK